MNSQWLRRLPVLRVYPALQEARDRLRDTKQKNASLKAHLGGVNAELRRLKAEEKRQQVAASPS